jgi:hypothetical protein
MMKNNIGAMPPPIHCCCSWFLLLLLFLLSTTTTVTTATVTASPAAAYQGIGVSINFNIYIRAPQRKRFFRVRIKIFPDPAFPKFHN